MPAALLGEWSMRPTWYPQGPGFEPGLFHGACYMPSSMMLNEAKTSFICLLLYVWMSIFAGEEVGADIPGHVNDSCCFQSPKFHQRDLWLSSQPFLPALTHFCIFGVDTILIYFLSLGYSSFSKWFHTEFD